MEKKLWELNGISVVIGEKMKEAKAVAEQRINEELTRAGHSDLIGLSEEVGDEE